MRDLVVEQKTPVATLTDALLKWTNEIPGNTAIGFLKGEAHDLVSFEELDKWAREIAHQLSEKAEVGTRVVLGFEQEVAYVAGFLGCVYAGMVAVTSAPPDELRRSNRLVNLLKDSGARIILTNGAVASKFEGLDSKAEIVDIDQRERKAVSDVHVAEPTDLMFLQYTSGSTSAPKGVMITHGSLAANLKAIGDDVAIHDRTVYVSWLPLYHDMGLIFMTLASLYYGREIHLMTPAEFLRRPDKWLQAISRLRGSLTAAPNFAYRMCVDRITPEQMKDIDLSCVERLINGSEPVCIEDMLAFYEKFKACGLNKSAAYCGYGMAELAVYACCTEVLDQQSAFLRAPLELEGVAVPSTKALDEVRELAPCGFPMEENFSVCIVDPETLDELPENHVGEVWLSGPSVGAGYWKKPEASEEIFDATTKQGSGPYLRTGDAGFLHEGCLYISGRLKEMMIVRGRNIYPADVCTLVEAAHASMKGRRAAAFSVPGDAGEELVLVCAARVSETNWKDAAGKFVAELTQELGVTPSNIVFVRSRDLDRTTSGKVQHSRMRARYLSGDIPVDFSLKPVPNAIPEATLEDVTEQPEPDEASWLQDRLCAILCKICETDSISPDRNIFELGLDSLRGVQLIEAIETQILGQSSDLTLSRLSDLKTVPNIASEVGSLLPQKQSQAVDYLEVTL